MTIGDDDTETRGTAAEAAFDSPAAAVGSALAGTFEDDPERGGVAVEAADVPPKPVT